MTVWIYNSKEIKAGRSWTDDNGVQHPANWNIWPQSEKDAMGIISVEPESPPDGQYYNWSMGDDYKITKSAKPLAGVKAKKIEDAKKTSNSLLSLSDWYVTRKAEADTAIPSEITALRTAVRTNYAALKSAINAAGDVDAIAALYSWTAGASQEEEEYEDIDGKKQKRMVPVKTKEFNGKTAVNSSTNTITSTGHGFVDNEMVVYSIMVSDSAIDGLTDGESYYVINKTTNTFKLSHSHSNCGDEAVVSLTGLSSDGTKQIFRSQGKPGKGQTWPDSRMPKYDGA